MWWTPDGMNRTSYGDVTVSLINNSSHMQICITLFIKCERSGSETVTKPLPWGSHQPGDLMNRNRSAKDLKSFFCHPGLMETSILIWKSIYLSNRLQHEPQSDPIQIKPQTSCINIDTQIKVKAVWRMMLSCVGGKVEDSHCCSGFKMNYKLLFIQRTSLLNSGGWW